MKIGIELNNIVRDINSQIIKYYKKDINKDFDDSTLDLNQYDYISKLPFKMKKDRNSFLYVDYPYEIFGCARTTERNLANLITEFEIKLNNLDDGIKYEIVHFSLFEIALTIQSTYFFLSKIGSRVRKVIFPKNGIDIWDDCDVVITTNPQIIKKKPNQNKVAVLIRTSDNKKAEKDADLSYNNLLELMNDESFIVAVKKIAFTNNKKNVNFIRKIKNKIIKMFKK